MRKHTTFLWVLISCACLSHVTGSELESSISPKLRQFMKETPTAYKALTNCLAEAFTNRTIQLYYFYSDDERKPRASHYYPDETVVGIIVRENQEPVDEFISLLFEAMNSDSQARYLGLASKAYSNQISREDFIDEILKAEFAALKRVREVVRAIKVTASEKEKSYHYKRLINCPDDFAEFVPYIKKVSPHRDPRGEEGKKYDWLRARTAKQ